MFFNTTRLRDKELQESKSNVLKQEQLILFFFTKNYGENFTPCEVWKHHQQFPLTSIRRSITNLTKKNRLEKLATKRVGMYGSKNYCWKLSTEHELKEMASSMTGVNL